MGMAPLLTLHTTISTLLDLKKTLLSALPMLKSNAPGGLPGLSAEDMADMDLPTPTPTGSSSSSPIDSATSTSDIVLWRARRTNIDTMDRFEGGNEELNEFLGYVCLEGDPAEFTESRGQAEQGERKSALMVQIKDIKQPVWERWVDVYVR
ncbi:hypothetical protein QFC22_004264 [Naganishia vaughanmartiniae]|uniref:Uncharacterized protein n=1 Tax=Naganishia vaughanmartiniae TaxID=1424756 RepID=A0ACC2X3J9_9TREE|nr:hypothetical protein QFC22_004264 [Naganishia vaughanmartiniae]